MDPLQAAFSIAASGMSANSARLRVTSENIANAQSTGQTPGADPYRRKTISFESAMDEVSGADVVKVSSIGSDPTPFNLQLDPGNPAADGKGFVKIPNVNLLMEMGDMREANRSYEANLQVIKQSNALLSMTIGLLKG
ncbi:MAG: flagellar basal body rod protein FlgC [Beijerinckiaceae bacterium]|nr:flagellar basal body rod protein FlgC [Beijerinckiaceae bacterium]